MKQQPEATKPPAAAAPLPTLRLDDQQHQGGDCSLDFGQVSLGQSRALPFAIAGGSGSGRLEVERRPPNVQVRMKESTLATIDRSTDRPT
jgi:hypothetical protein